MLGSPTKVSVFRRPPTHLVLAALLVGCGGGGGGSSTTGGGGGSPPPATTCPLPTPIIAPTFTRDILPALQSGSCGGTSATSCHGVGVNAATGGHISYWRTPAEVYNDLLHMTPEAPGYAFITPRDPNKSWLLVKITSDNPGGGYGTRMPQSGGTVCQATVDNVTAWINAGAPY